MVLLALDDVKHLAEQDAILVVDVPFPVLLRTGEFVARVVRRRRYATLCGQGILGNLNRQSQGHVSETVSSAFCSLLVVGRRVPGNLVVE